MAAFHASIVQMISNSAVCQLIWLNHSLIELMYNSLSHKEVNLSLPKTKLKNLSIISFAKVIDIALNPNKAGTPPLY